ncbi:hypothetical protein BGZ76_007857, partial [Entomortierella beljakovae]
DFIDYEKNEEDEEEMEEMEEGDYSIDTENEDEIQIESITDSNKMETIEINSNVASMNNDEVVNSSQIPTTVYVDSQDALDPQQPLDSEAESRADEFASALMTTQLAEYNWIQSTVPEEEILEIVKRLKIKKGVYDYLPRVFYVDKQDFDVWKEKDGDDHFFKWVNGVSRGRRTNYKVVAGDNADEDAAEEDAAGEDAAGDGAAVNGVAAAVAKQIHVTILY